MSEQLTTVIFDGLTGEQTSRPLTVEEIEVLELAKQQQADIQSAIAAKAEARESALAKLAALGLTEEEIAAL
jgi:DNA-binding CsgD family transcriptional regulator